MLINRALAGVLALGLLAGCAGSGLPDNATPRTELTAKCAAFVGLMRTAIKNKHLMDDPTKQTVTTIRQTIGPRCEDIDGVADTQSTLEAVDVALTRLRQIPAIQEAN